MVVRLIALTMLLMAAIVPSSVWIDALRSSSGPLRDKLLLGAELFRIGLGSLGVFVFVAARARLWGGERDEGQPLRVRTGGDRCWALAAILLAAACLRFYALDQDLWGDEVETLVRYARSPYGETVTTYETQNQHFLYTLLAHACVEFFGESAWALRLPATLFGVAGVWALYALAREVAGVGEALASATLLACSYHHVWFSQNARGYSGLFFWAVLASWLFLRGLTNTRSTVWLYYAGAVALGTYTQMNMVFVAGGHFVIYLWMLLTGRIPFSPYRWYPLLSGFLLAGLVSFTMHALVIPQILGPALADRSLVEAWKSPLWTLHEIGRGLNINFAQGGAALLGLAIAMVGSVSYLRQRPMVLGLLVIPLTLGMAVTMALGHPVWPRFFFSGLGFGILVAIRGARVLGEATGRVLRQPRWLGVASTLALISASAATLPFAYRPKQDFTGAKEYISQARRPHDAVVAVGVAAFSYENYYAPEWGTVATGDELDEIRRRSNRTWLVYTLPLHMESHHADIFALVQREFRVVRTFPGSLGGGDIVVCRYDRGFPRPDG